MLNVHIEKVNTFLCWCWRCYFCMEY